VSAADAMVAAVGVLCLLNLVLMLGIVRRLREHEEKLARPVPAADASDELTIPLGSRPAEFATVDVDGARVGTDTLRGGVTLVGFFATDCEGCLTVIPMFTEYAATLAGGRDRVVAVVAGGGEKAEEYTALLAGAARVVVEPAKGTVASAFAVRAYPTVGLLDEAGVLYFSGRSPKELPELTPA
jgi:thiol-disulfide isomerase/thioredoxin